jgi:hypothetical protein
MKKRNNLSKQQAMKKILVIMMAAFIPAFLLAQNTPLSALYDRYASKPGFETTEILPGSMSFEWEKTMDNSTIKEIMQNIESIRILKYKAVAENTEQEKFWKKMQKAAGDDQYKEVVNVNAENTRVNIFMMKEPAGNTREVALIAKNEEGITMVTVTGNIDFSAIFNKDNMESLREMAEYYMKNKGECKPE